MLALSACSCVVPGAQYKLASLLLPARPPLGSPHPETQAPEVFVS